MSYKTPLLEITFSRAFYENRKSSYSVAGISYTSSKEGLWFSGPNAQIPLLRTKRDEDWSKIKTYYGKERGKIEL